MTYTTASLEWHNGQPYSSIFKDIYFSSENGLQETEHVFINGNQLLTRWQQLTKPTFTIIETGFGTGLNFLCAAAHWLSTSPSHAVLHFVSIEKFPLKPEDFAAALQHWETLKPLTDELIRCYPQLLQSGTVEFFGGRVILTVHFTDACAALQVIQNNADAWFLDGFAPAKNPEMWQPELFEFMAQHSDIGSSVATFTSAGIVRRGLQTAGFQVTKQAGFGKKREMITGIYTGTVHDR